MSIITKSLTSIGSRLAYTASTCYRLGAPESDGGSDTAVCETAYRKLTDALLWAVRDTYVAALQYEQGRNNPYLDGVDERVRAALEATTTIVDHPVTDPGTRDQWWGVYSTLYAIRVDVDNVRANLQPGATAWDDRLTRDADRLAAISANFTAAAESNRYTREASGCLEGAARDLSYAADTARQAVYTAYAARLKSEAEAEAWRGIDEATEAEDAND